MRRKSFGAASSAWPAFADLMSGLLLVVVVAFTIVNLQMESSDAGAVQKCRKEKAALESQLSDSITKLEQCEQKVKECEQATRDIQQFRAVRKSSVEKLKQALSARNIAVVPDEYGTLEISASLLFRYADRSIRGEQMVWANNLGDAMRQVLEDNSLKDSIDMIMVIGHTDSEGMPSDNLALSQARAQALVDIWIRRWTGGQENVFNRTDVPKILAAGFGESRPKVKPGQDCGNQSPYERGCAKDRRIEIRLIPKESGVIH